MWLVGMIEAGESTSGRRRRGRTLLSEQGREHMRRGALVVGLRCRPETLSERVDVFRGRARLDGEGATDVVDTDARDIADVVTEMVEIWGS